MVLSRRVLQAYGMEMDEEYEDMLCIGATPVDSCFVRLFHYVSSWPPGATPAAPPSCLLEHGWVHVEQAEPTSHALLSSTDAAAALTQLPSAPVDLQLAPAHTAAQRFDVEAVPGLFLLQDVLLPIECEQIALAARNTGSAALEISSAAAQAVYHRVCALVPSDVAGSRPATAVIAQIQLVAASSKPSSDRGMEGPGLMMMVVLDSNVQWYFEVTGNSGTAGLAAQQGTGKCCKTTVNVPAGTSLCWLAGECTSLTAVGGTSTAHMHEAYCACFTLPYRASCTSAAFAAA